MRPTTVFTETCNNALRLTLVKQVWLFRKPPLELTETFPKVHVNEMFAFLNINISGKGAPPNPTNISKGGTKKLTGL